MTIQCDVDDYLWPWQKAEAVVMLHGTARNAHFWRRWVPYIAGERRVYRPEVRGFGRSDVPPEGYQFDTETILGDLRKVFDYCGIERAHFVGESSGAIQCIMFAVAEPERVLSLTLCDMPLKVPMEMRSFFALGERDQIAAIRRYGMGEWCRRTLHQQLDFRYASVELRDWYIGELAKVPPYVGAALQEYHRSVEPDVIPMLSRVQAPVLLLSGDQSRLAGNQQIELQGHLERARLKVFAGYGHGVSVLLPQECAEAARTFWDREKQ
jgi:3-oxoadipate enol-lactonase